MTTPLNPCHAYSFKDLLIVMQQIRAALAERNFNPQHEKMQWNRGGIVVRLLYKFYNANHPDDFATTFLNFLNAYSKRNWFLTRNVLRRCDTTYKGLRFVPRIFFLAPVLEHIVYVFDIMGDEIVVFENPRLVEVGKLNLEILGEPVARLHYGRWQPYVLEFIRATPLHDIYYPLVDNQMVEGRFRLNRLRCLNALLED